MRTDTKLPTFNFLGKDKWLPLITTREGNFDKNLRIKTSEYRLYGKLHRGGSAWSGNRYWGIHWSHIYFCPNLIVPRGAVSYFFLHLYRSAHCLVGSSQWIFMNKVANMPLRKYLPLRPVAMPSITEYLWEHTVWWGRGGGVCVCVCVCVCVKWYNLFHQFCRYQPFGRFYVNYGIVLPENKGGGRQEVRY